MQDLLVVAGLLSFSLALGYDFYTEWLSPRLLSQSWFPGEPDLPPVAGDTDEPKPENYLKVVLAGYLTGSTVLFIILLDKHPENIACVSYTGFLNVYVVGVFGLITTFMWYSEGQNIVMPYHSEVRYSIGVSTIFLTLYLEACGSGIL